MEFEKAADAYQFPATEMPKGKGKGKGAKGKSDFKQQAAPATSATWDSYKTSGTNLDPWHAPQAQPASQHGGSSGSSEQRQQAKGRGRLF